MSMQDGRNQRPGFALLRSRYVDRGVAYIRSDEFPALVRAERDAWIAKHPRYTFVPTEPKDLPVVVDPPIVPVLLPARLRDDVDRPQLVKEQAADDIEPLLAASSFQQMAERLAEAIWPADYFRYRLTAPHAGRAVGSAALLFYIDLVGQKQVIEQLLPDFVVGVQGLPHQPLIHDKLDIARAEGQRDYLLGLVQQLAGDNDDDRMSRIRHETLLAGERRAQQEFPNGVWPDDAQSFLFVQLVEGITAKDLCDAAQDVAAIAREVIGQSLKEAMARLRRQGLSDQQIGDRVGYSSATVRDQLRGLTR